MNLYVSGCSWTHGHNHDQPSHTYEHNGYQYYVDYKDPYVWVNHFEPYYDKVFNHARQGSGLTRMTRRLLEFLEIVPDTELSDWVFVLQVSQPNRQEFVVGTDIDMWSLVLFSRGSDYVPQLSIGYDDYWNEDSDKSRLHNEIFQDKMFCDAMVSAYINQTYKNEIYRQFVDLAFLINILKQRNLKYLITAMDPACFNPDYVSELFQSADLTRLVKQIDTTNFIKSSAEVMDPLNRTDIYDPCGHLNVEGNKIFANYIHTELKGHGFINE